MTVQVLEWLRRDRRHEPGLPALPESRARRVLLWALTCWTALGGLAMVFAQGDFSRMMAAGLVEHAGQRLLGVQLILLAVVYALAARQARTGGIRVPAWLPLAGQVATAVVILYDTVAGSVGFGSSWPVLCVALLFAVLLAGFSLAGQPAVHARSSQHAVQQRGSAAPVIDAATQRFGRVLTPEELSPEALAAPPGPTPPPADEPRSDERVLGA